MSKLISFIDKYRKVISCVLLLAVLGIVLPSTASAGWAKDLVEGAVNGFLVAIILAVSMLGIVISGALANIIGGMLLWIMSGGVGVSFTHMTGADLNPAILYGWPIARDLANIFIVLGFVIIGVSTALRFREYEAKKLLPKLIIAALLVNFSLLICGVFIDGSNIVTTQFLKGGGFLAKSAKQAVIDQVSIIWDKTSFSNIERLPDLVGTCVGFMFTNIMMIVVFALFFFMFLVRYMALWILVILSPLAFVFYVFPFTNQFFKMWWSNFFKWCVVGIPGAFFIYMADIIASNSDKFFAGGSPGIIGGILPYMIPGVFLVAGFVFTMKIGGMGAVIATAALGAVTGGVGVAAKLAANKSGLTKVGNAVKDKATATGERMGLVSQGTTANARKARLEEPTKRLEKAYDDSAEGNTELAKIATQKARFGTKAAEDKASAGLILAKRKALGYVSSDKQESVAAHAVAMGAPKEEFTKINPQLMSGADDKAATEMLRTREAARLEDAGIARSPEEAKKLTEKYKPSAADIAGEKKNMSQEIVRQRALGYVPVSRDDIAQKAKEYETKRIQGTTDPSTGANYTEAKAKMLATTHVPTHSEIVRANSEITAERVQKSIRKLSPDKGAELPTIAITKDTIQHFSEKQFSGIRRKGSADIVDAIDNYTPKTDSSGKTLPMAQQNDGFKQLYSEYKSLPAGSPEKAAAGRQLSSLMSKLKNSRV